MTLTEALDSLEHSGYQHRDNQIAMMRAVEDTLRHKAIAVIEGGTGIGKTFAYLIPALLNQPEKIKIVVATATVSLQEQLAYKDLPTVLKLLHHDVDVELAKGRRRYVCLNRLYNYDAGSTGQQDLLLYGIEESAHKPDAEAMAVAHQLVDQFEAETWNGDRDSLNFSVPDPVWMSLTTEASGCSNRRCGFFKICPFFQAKRRLAQVNVIITNHDLLLSDIGLGTGVLLPKAEECIYIIDEAHHLPQKAIQHFAASSSLQGSKDWLESLSKYVFQLQLNLKLEDSQVQAMADSINEIKDMLTEVRDFIDANYAESASDEGWVLAPLPQKLLEVAKPLADIAQALLKRLSAIRKKLLDKEDDKPSQNVESMTLMLGLYISRLEKLYRTWQLYAMTLPEQHSPIARWITPREGAKRAKQYLGQDYICHAAMTSGANLLPSYFWDKLTQGAILCSATLRALGNFGDFLEKTGLSFYPEVTTHTFSSPFPYERSRLVVPSMSHLPEGRDADQHALEVAKLLPGLLKTERHGVLVLFTSKKLLDTVYELMPSSVKALILKQGDLPKQLLLNAHRQRIDQGEVSIIFGMQSFAEGIDLPGDYCRHVIIPKLPFAVPSTPIEKVRLAWLESQGRNAFLAHTLPEASIRLTQYAGRLIRTEEDQGSLTIMDRRIVVKGYGKALLNNLPPFKRVIE